MSDLTMVRAALYRGWISLDDVVEAARQRGDLIDALIASGALVPEQHEALRRSGLVELGAPDATLVIDGSAQEPDTARIDLSTGMGLRPEPVDLAAPDRGGRRYGVGERLGLGGMGEVWLATDERLRREVAMKSLRGVGALDAHVRASRERQLMVEASLTGGLEHPGIVPIYDMGEDEELGAFYTMRVVREPTLGHVMRARCSGEHGHVSRPRLLGIVRAALQALGYAHTKGVVHRDIKPENILVGSFGEVFVIDWGIAKSGVDGLIPGDIAPPVEPNSRIIGTPTYMAPEQARAENHLIDARADVYAMGVILYEILTMRRFIDERDPIRIVWRVSKGDFVAPRERAPEQNIPLELEEIVLEALALAREDRFSSALEMADALGSYLEGLEDSERRLHDARQLTDEATETRLGWERLRDSLSSDVLRAHALRDRVSMRSSLELKRPLWVAERDIEHKRLELESIFSEMVASYSRALGHVRDYAPARRALAGLYWERFVDAERARDAAGALYFEGLVRQFNDGDFDERLIGDASVTFRGHPGASVRVQRVIPGLRAQRLEQLGEYELPVREMRLPHGSYVMEVSSPGYMTQNMPLLLERLAHETVEFEMVVQGRLPEDAVVVSAGMFLSGEFEPLAPGRGLRHLPRFAMMRHSVTCGEYVAFLNDLVKQGRLDEADKHAPRLDASSPSYFPCVSGEFIVPRKDADGDEWDPSWPICMISYRDALAYASWRATRDGVPWRLPTALEWEKAARGVDGRVYPWGNQFEPSFCNMRESYQGRSMPRPVGTHPEDMSPYGVFDVVGNVLNWTSTFDSEADRTRALCGASYSGSATGVKLYDRISAPESFRYSAYGMRLACSC